MKLITRNPYRIIGIHSNASLREIQSKKGKIQAFARVGKEITGEYDFPFLSPVERNSSLIDSAFSGIEQNQDRVNHALFWFVNMNPIDNTAIQHLMSGNKEKAIEIWEKVAGSREISSKSFTAYHNTGTLYLLETDKDRLMRGIGFKIRLIESDYFKELAHAVADETFSIDPQKQVESFINELLVQFKDEYTPAETMELFSGCGYNVQQYLAKKFTEDPVRHIEVQIEQAQRKRNNNKRDANQVGINLYKNTQQELRFLKSVIGPDHLQYKLLSDNLAKELLQCGIDYFNEFQDTGDPSKKSIILLKGAKMLSSNPQTMERIENNISAMEEFAKSGLIKPDIAAVADMLNDEESKTDMILAALEPFNQAKNNIHKASTLLKKATPHLLRIKAVLGGEDPVYLQISTSVVAKAENYVVESINGAQKYAALSFGHDDLKKRLKEAWQVTLQLATLDMIPAFREHFEQNKKALKNVCGQVNVSTSDVSYGSIPQLHFLIIGSELTNTDGNNGNLPVTHPMYDENTRFVGLKLKVKVLANQTVDFYIRYILPDGKYSNNPEVSPKGYTKSIQRTLITDHTEINLSGWGNADKCTYAIGKHKIDVYVNGFKIYQREFSVDLSPTQKIEIEIKAAKAKLAEVKNTVFLDKEIRAANFVMDEIMKFKFLRSSAEKRKQIMIQQQKIDNTKIRAIELKQKEILLLEAKIKALEIDFWKSIPNS